MKIKLTKTVGSATVADLLCLLWLPVQPNLPAQPAPHHFSGIAALPDNTINLSLDGSVSNLFNLTGAIYDELKNQWGWGGFRTQDLHRDQVTVRNVALVYNGWRWFVRCAEPKRPREAIPSRPLSLCASSA